jgi:hypothetical protein
MARTNRKRRRMLSQSERNVKLRMELSGCTVQEAWARHNMEMELQALNISTDKQRMWDTT